MQKAEVYRNGQLIGFIQKDEFNLYQFNYTDEYLNSENSMSISVNFPLQQEPFISSLLFSFFFNLLAEGAVKDIQCRELKIDPDDHFSRLLKTTESNTIGSITLKEILHEMS